MERHYKADAVIEKPKVAFVVELTKEIEDKILALPVIDELTVKIATATSRAQARVWLAKMNADGKVKTAAEISAAIEADAKEI